MKKILFAMLALSALVLLSCNKDDNGGSNAKVTFRKANISGAKMLALAKGGAATKAEGDVYVGPNALYTVSADGSMVQVTYNVDVEGANSEVAETIKANLIISPGFVFPVGEGWLWLANCYYDVVGGWADYPREPRSVSNALSKIINDFRDTYHARHGAHYLIRKSDGALFEWTVEAGAPDGMDDGFKQPTFLNGWFHQLGKDLFVKKWGWDPNDGGGSTLFRLQDNGSTLDAVNLLGDNIQCNYILPAEEWLGASLSYSSGGFSNGILAAPGFKPQLLPDPAITDEGIVESLVSVAGKLYVAVTYYKENQYGNSVPNTDFYHLDTSSGSVKKGNLICSYEGFGFLKTGGGVSGANVSGTETISWWDGNTIITFDPKAAKVSSRTLPDHYPGQEAEYVDGVGYAADGTNGYWECDLSKDAAEYVTLDWSSAAQYQRNIVPGSLRLVRFEAASMTLQYIASLSDGTELNFYTSVTGADKGIVKTTVGHENNAGMVVTTMVRLN